MNKDDLLNLNNNKKNIKKPLIYGAIAFLVFIIAILGFAIYSNTNTKQDNVVLPPQVNEQTKNNNEPMFKEVPIEEDNVVQTSTNQTKTQKKENSENLAQKLINNENENKKNTPAPQPTPEQITKPKPKIQKEVKKVVAVKKQHKKIINSKYYIQVAALMKYKKPNKNFLKLIKKEGYNYKLYETSYIRNGKKIEVVKILVGPFSKNNVRKELRKIKEKITQNAFIFKVK